MSEEIHEKKWTLWVLCVFLVLLTLTSRILVAYYLASDAPGDGVVYARIARNVLEQGVYSTDAESPFSSTLIRMPGYPLFLAAVYSLAGHDNNTAVRITQAVFDTATCVLIALIAFLWTDDGERKRRNAFWAFILAMLCPFIVIYVGTILTETLTTFLMAAMALTATLGFQALTSRKAFIWWGFTGLLSGMAVLLRPDSGLFAAGIGSTLVISGLFFASEDSPTLARRLMQVSWRGAVFAAFFIVALTPWTIRNYRTFGVFQPLSPKYAAGPNEFVPLGYYRWLRTWIDDSRFIEPMQWNLGEKPIILNDIPAREFDSAGERDLVAALLDKYNHPPGSEAQHIPGDTAAEDNSSDEADSVDDSSDNSADDSGDEASDSEDMSDQSSGDDENQKYVVEMTPEIDAQFGQIAEARIARSPFRYYIFLPAKRAAAQWFDSHSLYYPFGGQMSPIRDLDFDEDQQYWLPAFTLLTWIYTILAFGGFVVLWRKRANRTVLRWLLLIVMMVLPRIVFLSTMENPEQRYDIEFFAFTAILGGFWLGKVRLRRQGDEVTKVEEPLKGRLLSLDVFRGLTIAGMTLVNWPGTWSAVYPPLTHAGWNGATPTDWIFPFFLFIVGVSVAFALGNQIEREGPGRPLYLKIFKRAGILFGLGLLLEIYPFYNIWTAAWFDPSTTRIMGVLQRIAICYLVASLIFLHSSWRRQAVVIGAILLIYWGLMTLVSVPGCDITSLDDKVCNLASYIDRITLGPSHIWEHSKVLDPEGLLTTLPAIATTLAGVLAGQWLRSAREGGSKFRAMLISGCALAFVGWIWGFWLPLNKWLWTSSYVVYTAGLALVFLSALFWLIDLKGYTRWSKPFLIFGTNAIALYVLSTIIGNTLTLVELSAPNDKTVTLQERIFNDIFMPLASPVNASLLYAISYVLIWLFLIWLLYRRRIFIKL